MSDKNILKIEKGEVIQQSRLISEKTKEVEDLKCGECNNFSPLMVECNECEAIYCQNCVCEIRRNTNRCPNKSDLSQIRGLWKIRKLHRFMQEKLNSLVFECKHSKSQEPIEEQYQQFFQECHQQQQKNEGSNLCRQQFKFEDLEKHEKICEFSILKCLDCEKKMQKMEFQEHQKQCIYVKELCKKCQIPYQRKDKEIHDCIFALGRLCRIQQQQILFLQDKKNYQQQQQRVNIHSVPHNYSARNINRVDNFYDSEQNNLNPRNQLLSLVEPLLLPSIQQSNFFTAPIEQQPSRSRSRENERQ